MYKNFIASFLLIISLGAKASLHICSFAFNSTDERDALYQELKPLGATLTEFVPKDSKDPRWFEEQCQSVKKCDITVFSGYFGGVFFGEGSSITLSMAELINSKLSNSCPNVLSSSKTVMLMGCNTMASKKKDHRTIHEYLSVLLNDGFPLDLAEKVTATRYMNYGESNEEIMSSIFSDAKVVLGFESTGPLGKYAGPQLRKAIRNSSEEKRRSDGFDIRELQHAFKGTSLKISYPQDSESIRLKKDALTLNAKKAGDAWKEILDTQNREKYIDFIVRNHKNMYLKYFLKYDTDLRNSLYKIVKAKISQSHELVSIQLELLEFMKTNRMIESSEFLESFNDVFMSLIDKDIDYIRASQLCKISKSYPSEVKRIEKVGMLEGVGGDYSTYLKSCRGIESQNEASTVLKCLERKSDSDWNCLTSNRYDLNVKSCLLAASRNNDIENSDDMLWYCYSKMRNTNQLDRAECLELTDHFQILGNQLKMNWNCLNRVNK